MPCDTYAFEADFVDSRKLNMVATKQSQERLGPFNDTSTSCSPFRQRRTSPNLAPELHVVRQFKE